jgi:hypothetical protein
MQAYFKDAATSFGGRSTSIAAGTGIATVGSSGPSATQAAATSYLRRKSASPLLDNIFGVQNG